MTLKTTDRNPRRKYRLHAMETATSNSTDFGDGDYIVEITVKDYDQVQQQVSITGGSRLGTFHFSCQDRESRRLQPCSCRSQPISSASRTRPMMNLKRACP